MSEQPDIVLYRAIACPYSHRVELVLGAKGLSADKREIDLLQRPGWFMAMASSGRIPLLEVDGFVVPFGDRVNEFLDERFPSAVPMLGSTAEARAEARTMIDWCTGTLGPTYEPALMNVDPVASAALFDRLGPVLAELEARLGVHPPAPYWHGEQPGIVDFTYASILLRFVGLERFHKWSMPDGCPLVAAWRATLVDDPIVQAHTDLEGIVDMLAEYRRIFTAALAS